jgi:glycosyltransferase involved in cell wall biosynthesis
MTNNQLPLPLITIIIPCHNKADTIARAIDSVKTQTLNNLECIIINDASSDNSEQVILEAIEGDARFRYETVEYRNVAKVRNHGATMARGIYLCPLDGDDWIGPAFLEVCVQALQADRSLGIAYTGLKWYKKDGTTGISEWPGKWDYDAQLQRRNQVPTCSVIRKVCWDRLGGQRARYCPTGAGAEDGEFYLRAGAYGFKAALVEPHASILSEYRKVTKDLKRPPKDDEMKDDEMGRAYDVKWEAVKRSLFNYSWLSGHVTGDKDYKEVDWTAWHPWARDGQHPFASYAKPLKHSHPVRAYDKPAVSVIIPVGPGHETALIDALDSLEAQTFRKWEVIVVWDREDLPMPETLSAGPAGRETLACHSPALPCSSSSTPTIGYTRRRYKR